MAVMSMMAAATVITHLSQAVGISFRLYAILVALAMFSVALAMGRASYAGIVATLRSAAVPAGALALIGLLSALFVLLRHRPNTDDFWYISNVVYYVAHPGQAMGYLLYSVEAGDTPISSFYQGTALPFEYAQGALAYLLGLHVLSFYHVLVPAVLAFLQPLVWFHLLSRFEFRDRSAICGTVVISLCLLLMGDTRHSFGSYGLDRIWQGKVVVMAVGLPLFVALTIDFLRSRDRGPWLRLFICATALVGMSPSTIVLLSLLTVLLAVSGAVAFPDGLRATLRTIVIYGLSLSYVAAFAVAFLFLSAGDLGSGSPINAGWPRTFLGQAVRVFARRPSVTLALFVASLCCSFIVIRGWQRRFLAAWLSCALIAYLNPLVAPFLIDRVTSPNLYWRLFYLLPFPLALGLIGAALAQRAGVGTSVRGNLIAGLAVLLLGVAHWLPGFHSVLDGQGLWLGYKITPATHELARELADAGPPGTMLVSWPLGGAVSMLSGQHPLIRTHIAGMRLWFTEPEVGRRVAASNFLQDVRSNGEGLNALLELTDLYPEIRSVVALTDVAERYDLEPVLAAKGFTEIRQVDALTVFVKPPSG